LLKKDGKNSFEQILSPPDLVLAGMDDTLYNCRDFIMNDGDTIFLYTDGIPEAADISGKLYENERLIKYLDNNTDKSFKELLPSLREDIRTFSCGAEQSDDIAMLILRFDRRK